MLAGAHRAPDAAQTRRRARETARRTRGSRRLLTAPRRPWSERCVRAAPGRKTRHRPRVRSLEICNRRPLVGQETVRPIVPRTKPSAPTFPSWPWRTPGRIVSVYNQIITRVHTSRRAFTGSVRELRPALRARPYRPPRPARPTPCRLPPPCALLARTE